MIAAISERLLKRELFSAVLLISWPFFLGWRAPKTLKIQE
jgi:hypothetical protein